MCLIQAALAPSAQNLTAAAMLGLIIQVTFITCLCEFRVRREPLTFICLFRTAMAEHPCCQLRPLYSQAKTVDNDRSEHAVLQDPNSPYSTHLN